jgi:hypothetical protein
MMTTSNNTEPLSDYWQLEYSALREEILRRIELRQQFVSITLTIAAAFLGFGLNQDTLTLVYSPLAMFLALGWAQNDYRIRSISAYIRDSIEPYVKFGWETKTQHDRDNERGGLGSWRPVVVSHGGIFILTQILATGIGAVQSKWTALDIGLFILDLVSIAVVFILLWTAQRSGKAKDDNQLPN